jgi:acyl-CoA synthetase (AMP-forming)/AMP-acid ligase II
MNIANLLPRAARTYADSPALYLGERLLADYRTLAERAARLAAALSSELGALPGDRVAVVMSNVPEYLEVLYGSWFAGLAVAPINVKLHAAELASILRDLQPCVVFFSADLLDLEREVAASVPEAHYVIVAAAPYQELLHTGDVGSLDEDGFLTLTDRIKDLIISGGSNIYPREIEDVLLNHPLVSAVAVVGRPHPDWGEEVVAFVQARSGFTVSVQQLDALCLGSLARYKRPRQYFFVDELPQGGNGKVLKAQLRRRLAHSARDSSRN